MLQYLIWPEVGAQALFMAAGSGYIFFILKNDAFQTVEH